jgi:hypothetical protein
MIRQHCHPDRCAKPAPPCETPGSPHSKKRTPRRSQIQPPISLSQRGGTISAFHSEKSHFEKAPFRLPQSAVLLLFLPFVPLAHAHVGSPDVYAEGNAGPYKLSVVIRPPLVIPGVAEVDVRALSPGVRNISITPLALVGEASKHPPTPDAMKTPTSDASYFTGQLWIMAPGSWQIRMIVDGDQGHGVWSVPLPAVAMGTRPMQRSLGVFLAILGVILVIGMTGIVGAAAREAQLAPGAPPTPQRRRKAVIAMTVAFALLVTGVILGNWWWKSDAADYATQIYKPLAMDATLTPGNVLDLKIKDPGWFGARHLDDFIPDHNHLMHLYMIRWPQMDVVFHLHPQPVATGEFTLPLPTIPAGDYRLYADVVHASGFPETMVSTADLPAINGRPLARLREPHHAGPHQLPPPRQLHHGLE